MAAGKKKTGLSPGEKRRLRQLMGPLSSLSDKVGDLVRANTDFQAVFSQVGESFSKGEPAVETFRSLWSGLMDPSPPDQDGTETRPSGQEEAAHAQST